MANSFLGTHKSKIICSVGYIKNVKNMTLDFKINCEKRYGTSYSLFCFTVILLVHIPQIQDFFQYIFHFQCILAIFVCSPSVIDIRVHGTKYILHTVCGSFCRYVTLFCGYYYIKAETLYLVVP